MKTNDSFTASAPTMTDLTAGALTHIATPYHVGLAVVAGLVMLASGWFVACAARHPAPAAVAAVTSSHW